MVDIAQSIVDNRERILALWTEAAKEAASARGLSPIAFRNMIAQYLSALADPPAQGDDGRQQLLEQHLSTRLRQGFELAEIVKEISLLGECVADLWANSIPSKRPDPVQVHFFYARLQRDAALVTSVFTRHMLEDEQREKRFRRSIRSIADEALLPLARPFQERYPELLQLVMVAMGAQSATLLLADSEAQRLEMAGAVGVGGEQMHTLTHGLHLPWPPEEVSEGSRHADPVREVEVSDALRQGGIHSLLSAPLGPGGAPVGLLVIGTLEKRPFSARERRCLEGLAEQLTFHLVSARLFADLSSTITELHRERSLRELFVAVLAHDLRGPLTAAKLAAHLLARAEDLDASDRTEVEGTINRNIVRMDGMIQDLLDVSRMRAGQEPELQLAPCNLATLAVEVVQELRGLYKNPFAVKVPDSVVGIWSEDGLRRSIWNLASNAAKYGTVDALIQVEVTCTQTGARVSVHNLGPVISAEDQQHLFLPFSRTSNGQAGPHQGWGLGLASVRACAEAHGGQVSLTSDLATGTTFYLDLPTRPAIPVLVGGRV